MQGLSDSHALDMCIYVDSHALDMCIYLDSGVFIKNAHPHYTRHASPPLPPIFNVEGHGYVEFVFEKMGDFYAEVGARVASLSLNVELGGDGGTWLRSNHDGRFL